MLQVCGLAIESKWTDDVGRVPSSCCCLCPAFSGSNTSFLHSTPKLLQQWLAQSSQTLRQPARIAWYVLSLFLSKFRSWYTADYRGDPAAVVAVLSLFRRPWLWASNVLKVLQKLIRISCQPWCSPNASCFPALGHALKKPGQRCRQQG